MQPKTGNKNPREWTNIINGRQRHAGRSTTSPSQQKLHKLLERLCALTEVQESDRRAVLDKAVMTLNGTAVAFKLEEWSDYVKVYVDVGLPPPESEHELYRYLLEQQLYIPVPFSMVPGVQPESGRIVLCAFAPLLTDKEGDNSFSAFLHACVEVAMLLKSKRPELGGVNSSQ